MIARKLPVTVAVVGGIILLAALLFDRNLQFVYLGKRVVVIALFVFGLFLVALYYLGHKATLYFAITYLLAALLLEAGTRLWLANFASRDMRILFTTASTASDDLGADVVYVPHHYALYHLRPGLRTQEGTAHNSLGMRDHREFTDKPPGALRVVFIGGSTTYTVGILDNAKIFSRRLEYLLDYHYRSVLPGTAIQVINAGMGAATSAENLLRLMFFVSELRPDLVVIQHGLNDVWPRTRKGIQSDFSNYRKSWGEPDYFRARPLLIGLLTTLVHRSVLLSFVARMTGLMAPTQVEDLINRRDVPVDDSYVRENDARFFERNTRYMIAVCRSMGAAVLLASEVYTERAGKARLLAMPEHNAILARLAQSEKVAFFDFHTQMKKDDEHVPDGRRVSQVGSDLKADLFFRYFRDHELIPSLRR